jgi:hypothetical protein
MVPEIKLTAFQTAEYVRAVSSVTVSPERDWEPARFQSEGFQAFGSFKARALNTRATERMGLNSQLNNIFTPPKEVCNLSRLLRRLAPIPKNKGGSGGERMETGIIISGRIQENQRMEWIKCKIRTVFYSRGFNLLKTLQFKTSFFGMRIIPPYFSAIKIP